MVKKEKRSLKHFHTEVSPYLRMHSSKKPFLSCYRSGSAARYVHLPRFMITSQEIDAIRIPHFQEHEECDRFDLRVTKKE